MRNEIDRNLPTQDEIASGKRVEISVDVGEKLRDEIETFRKAVEQGDLAWIVGRYPLRESPALAAIATSLGFQNRTQYESAVRKLLADDADALQFIRTLFGSLCSDLGFGG